MLIPKPAAIVTDIEGTTSSLSFVKDVLFPYAQERLPAFIVGHASREMVRSELQAIRALENNLNFSVDECIAVLLRWISEDKKAGPLKALQGMIWEEGYAAGAFKGHLYPDVAPRLKEWNDDGIILNIYSSGSILAQKLLFGHTEYGDLTPLFSGYFDTGIGGKLETNSYVSIAQTLAIEAPRILFLSDHIGELDAARNAGYATLLLNRDHTVSSTSGHAAVANFTSITFS